MSVGKGFTLLELILSIGLSCIISVLLIGMWQQMGQIKTRVDWYSDLYYRVSLLHQQFERDLAGACMPVEADMSQAGVPEFGLATTNQDAVKEVGGIKVPDIEKPFWADHQCQLVTFITNNPIKTYTNLKSGRADPALARIVYKLVPDGKYTDSFTLMRQQGPDLNLGVYTQASSSVRSYPLVEGIKSITLTYEVLVKVPPDKDSKKRGPVFDRKKVDVWHAISDQKPPWPFLPQSVYMHVELWDKNRATPVAFDFEYRIMPRFEKQPIPKRPIVRQPATSVGVVPGVQVTIPATGQASLIGHKSELVESRHRSFTMDSRNRIEIPLDRVHKIEYRTIKPVNGMPIPPELKKLLGIS